MSKEATVNEIWTEVGALTGHAGPVKGIAWSPGGEYLISAGYVKCPIITFRSPQLFMNKFPGLIRRLAYMRPYQQTKTLRSPFRHGTK